MNPGTLWLIGGTQESAELARAIAPLRIPCLISVTTASARLLYPPAPTLSVRVGTLDAEQVEGFLQAARIGAILDASHPFATTISQLAIAAAARHHLPYLRYERPEVQDTAGILYLDSFATLLAGNYLEQQRVLLTLGYRALAQFQPWQARSTLFARILPSLAALETALEAGFTPDHLIALRPPISLDLERALWQQWRVSLVVTKASGIPGGEAVKAQVAAELGVQLVAIARPKVTYPQQTSDLAAALTFCQQLLLPLPP